MSAQGGTLARRGAVHLPIWPVAALLGAAIVAVVGMSILSGNERGVVTSVSDAQRLANSSAAIREQGATLPIEAPAVNPGMWTTTQAEAYLARLAAIEGSAAAVREIGAALPFPGVNPGMWTQAQAEAYVESRVTHVVGLENPGAYAPAGTSYVSGLENPGAYLGDAASVPTPKAGGPERIVVNGEVCHQCL